MTNLHQHVSVFARAFVALTISAVLAGDLPPEIEELRACRPSVLVPGCTTPTLEADPPGYYVSTLVTRYFDDETLADLRVELDLTARQQFLRFMAAGRSDVAGRAIVEVRGFRNIGMWWEEDSLHGLYFVPLEGVSPIDTEAARPPDRKDGEVVAHGPSAAELLLESRTLRKQHQFQSARDTLGRLRKEFPASPESRRALRETYFVNRAESRIRAGKEGE
jgi:hypothetical protein